MSPACCLLLLVGLGPDAGANLPPPWLPKAKRMDISDHADYGLTRSGESYTYETPHFQARVARDGVVSFKDKPSLFPSFRLSPTPHARAVRRWKARCGATSTSTGVLSLSRPTSLNRCLAISNRKRFVHEAPRATGNPSRSRSSCKVLST